MVERSDRPIVSTFLVERVEVGTIDLGEDAAHHAHVKRLEPGEAVFATDGKGRRGTGRLESVSKKSARAVIDDVVSVPAPAEVHLIVPVADKDRMLWAAEKATELQASSWTPIMYERSKSVTPRGEGESFDRKLQLRMAAALEQSGGAWLPKVDPVRKLEQIASGGGFVLERGGAPLRHLRLAPPVRIAIGPEGGFTPEELSILRDAGWTVASMGDVTLRFETAAIAALATVRALLS
jgi:16S rRNA (uracil1498-N3)-methyltransferase